jgi:hypothetical protein
LFSQASWWLPDQQLLPTSSQLVGITRNQNSERSVELLRITFVWKYDPCNELNTWSIGFDPSAQIQFVDNRRLADFESTRFVVRSARDRR